MDSDIVKQKIQETLPDANIVVVDMTGTGTNFAIDVVSKSFQGLNTVKQHKIIYEAVNPLFNEGMHSLQIKTSIQ